ncbi:MAG: hypothetical protein K6F06_01095 [Bacteroidales bacterium]|nr:hypothetical protein [Bacteroidales bacterium]
MIGEALLFSSKSYASDFLKENVDGLTRINPDDDKTCYMSINYVPGIKTLYCGECKYIKGAPSAWSLTDECDEIIGEGTLD